MLPAGDHAFWVSGRPTQERYRLSLSRLDPFDLAVDQEPNDGSRSPRRCPRTCASRATVEAGDEADWYRLDPLPAAGELTFRTRGRSARLAIDDGLGELAAVRRCGGSTYRSPPLPAGASIALGVVADGPYAVAVDPGTTGLVAGARRQSADAARRPFADDRDTRRSPPSSPLGQRVAGTPRRSSNTASAGARPRARCRDEPPGLDRCHSSRPSASSLGG